MQRRMYAVIREHGPGWNRSLPMEEQELWAEHAQFMEALVAESFILLGGPLGDGDRVLLAVEAEDADTVRRRLDADPWTAPGLLGPPSIEPWTIRLDARG